MNQNLRWLYEQFDLLYRHIRAVCVSCPDHDCEGYVWLLQDEADLLLVHGEPIIEINDHICFIHSFEEAGGRIVVDKPKPPCRFRESGLCSIYELRPLVCRMYPVGFITSGQEIVLVLHRDCRFSRELAGEGKKSFIRNVLSILYGAAPALLDEIARTYREVDAISAFPEGPNSYEILASLGEITGKGGRADVKVQGSAG